LNAREEGNKKTSIYLPRKREGKRKKNRIRDTFTFSSTPTTERRKRPKENEYQ
jgi:hypothetical protein